MGVVFREEAALDDLDERVQDEHVDLLDPVGVEGVQAIGGADDPLVVAHIFEGAAVLAEEADGDHLAGLRFCDGAEDVLGIAGGGEGDEDIAGIAESLDPAGEDVFEAVVVGDAGDVAGIGAGDGGEWAAVFAETPGEFLGEVHGIADGAAVAADENLVARAEALREEFAHAIYALEVRGVGDEGVEDEARIGKGLGGDAVESRHGGSVSPVQGSVRFRSRRKRSRSRARSRSSRDSLGSRSTVSKRIRPCGVTPHAAKEMSSAT